MATKKENKREATRNAVRVRHGQRFSDAKRDSMSASRRCYGRGVGK